MKRDTKHFKLIAFACVIALLSMGAGAMAETQKPDDISVMVQVNYQEAPDDTNDLELLMEDFTNTNVDIIWVPVTNYEERFNMAVASDDLPMAVSTPTNIKNQTFINAALGGMFWDITDLLKNYPELSSHYNENMLKNAQINGRLYGLPRARPLTRDGIIYRKDWAEKLGLEIKQPATLDDIYEIIKAFATKDPDGNGKNDTYGLLMGVGSNGALIGFADQIVDVANGGGNEWQIDENGNFEYVLTTKEHLATLNFFKRLYDEGLMNKDFATVNASQFYELLDQEAAGFFFQTLTDAHERLDTIVGNVQARTPELADMAMVDAKVKIFDTIYQIQSTDGTVRAHTQSGFNGWWAFSKKANPTEADLDKVLRFFDKMDSPDGQSVLYWGKQGVTWDYVNGVATMTGDSSKFSMQVQPYWQLFCTNRETNRASIQGYTAPMYTKVYAEMSSLLPYAVYNPTTPLISATYLQDGAYLDSIIYDAQVKYIMGLIDETGWWDAVAQWKAAGGDQVAAEYTAQYNELNKK